MINIKRLMVHMGLKAIGVLALGILIAGPANAMPSFARQTGMSCNQCHFTHDPTPNFTIQGMKFRSIGYRIPERQTKLIAGQPGATAGESLDLPWNDYLSYRFESVLANKTFGDNSTELASNPTTRLAWFVVGPVTDHIGFWNEFYIVGDYGGNNCLGGSCVGGSTWAPGLTTWDEYDLVYTVNPDAVQQNGDIYSIRFTNQSIQESDGWGPNSIGAPNSLGPSGELDGNAHPPTGAYRITGWMHDRWDWQLGLRTGDNNNGWDHKMEEASLAYYFDNASDNTIGVKVMGQYGDDEIPYVTRDGLQEGVDQNPLIYTYNDAIPGITATRPANAGPYLNTDLKNNVAFTPVFRWQRSDVGASGGDSWAFAAGFAYGKDEYNDGASFKEEIFGAGFLYCYMHTYCIQPGYTHYMKYNFIDHTGVSYDIDNPDTVSLELVYNPAMNVSVFASISQAHSISLIGSSKTGGTTVQIGLDFPM
jgi:hypothetical protein